MMHGNTESAAAPATASGHLHWLDWLRFIAALMVVAIHARGGLWVEWGRLAEESRMILGAAFFAVTRAGAEWVLVFFVLSGFLVGGKVIERLESGTFNLRNYVIDRFTRIWVPLIPALVWSALVAQLVDKPLSWFDLWGNLAGLQGVFVKSYAGNYPLWSLAYEIWFYFLAGCLAVWILSGGTRRIIAGFAMAFGLAIFTKLDVVFLFAWVLGALTYWLYHHPRNPGLAAVGGLLIVAGYVFSQLRSATISVDTSTWLHYAPSVSVAMLVLSSGIALVLPYLTKLEPKSSLGKRIDAIGGRLAAFSYTLYLTHYPALYLWEYLVPGRHEVIDFASITWYVIRIASCIAVSWLLYLPFEKQTKHIRRFLSQARVGKATHPVIEP